LIVSPLTYTLTDFQTTEKFVSLISHFEKNIWKRWTYFRQLITKYSVHKHPFTNIQATIKCFNRECTSNKQSNK